MNLKRKLDIAVISDVHLGAYDGDARKLLNYLNSINPKHLILNGGIIDTWHSNKTNFQKTHLKVIKKIMNLALNGTKVTYVKGNYDAMAHKFVDTEVADISIVNKLLLDLDGKKAWFFHGDVLDIAIQNFQWVSKFGNWSYNMLMLYNQAINWYLKKRGKERLTFSQNIKNNKKKVAKFINDFENAVTDLAIANNYDYVVCGHIHQPVIKVKTNSKGSTTYLNSGDWIVNFTALEYRLKRWKLYNYTNDKLIPFIPDEELKDLNIKDMIAAITIVEQPNDSDTLN